MTDQATIEETQTDRMSVGRVPVRMAAGGTMHYYIVACPHGETEMHENMDLSQQGVVANLIADHHRSTECTCQPAS